MRFEKSTHTYYNDNKVAVNSVTQILSELGITPSYDGVPEFYAKRGTLVHKVAETICENLKSPYDIIEMEAEVLAEESDFPADAILPYVKKLYGVRGTLSEYQQLNPEEMFAEEYAGTADVVTEDTVIDWKTSKKQSEWHQLQVAAYMTYFQKKKGFVCYITPDKPLVWQEVDPEYVRKWGQIWEHYKRGEKNKAKKIWDEKVELTGSAAEKLYDIKVKMKRLKEEEKKITNHLKAKVNGRNALYTDEYGDGFKWTFQKTKTQLDKKAWEKWLKENHPEILNKREEFKKKEEVNSYRMTMMFNSVTPEEIDRIVPKKYREEFWIYASYYFEKNKEDLSKKELETAKSIAKSIKGNEWEIVKKDVEEGLL